MLFQTLISHTAAHNCHMTVTRLSHGHYPYTEDFVIEQSIQKLFKCFELSLQVLLVLNVQRTDPFT